MKINGCACKNTLGTTFSFLEYETESVFGGLKLRYSIFYLVLKEFHDVLSDF